MKQGIESFFDLVAWQEGHKLTLKTYKITKKFPADERFGLTSQLRRAASSVTANIAEGQARFHFKDKNRFYYQARGSIAEVQNFLVLARDLQYIARDVADELQEKAISVHQLINGMIRAIDRHQSANHK